MNLLKRATYGRTVSATIIARGLITLHLHNTAFLAEHLCRSWLNALDYPPIRTIVYKQAPKRLRINSEIRATELRVIGPEGENLGVIPFADALARAQAASLDLIEISPSATPPVAKIMDFGKYQYLEAKKERDTKAKAHTTETKAIQVEVGTAENDLTRKARQAAEWLREGHRVKIELFLKGRYKYMDPAFLKERLERFVLLVPEEYKIAQPVERGPKGFLITLERAGKGAGKAASAEKKPDAGKKPA